MTHQDVKQLRQELTALINHVVEKKVDIYHVNYGLDKNLSRLKSAVEEIDKHVNQELKDLETKVLELAKAKDAENPRFDLSLLPKKDQKRHDELMVEHNKAMQEPNDFAIYFLDPKKCEDLKIEFPFLQILKKFFPAETELEVKPE